MVHARSVRWYPVAMTIRRELHQDNRRAWNLATEAPWPKTHPTGRNSRKRSASESRILLRFLGEHRFPKSSWRHAVNPAEHAAEVVGLGETGTRRDVFDAER